MKEKKISINRKKKLYLSTSISLIRQVVSVVCGFILPHAILGRYGSEVNGLVSSITQFLGFIAMAECGVSSVVQANLYKPLVDRDSNSISKIFVSSERFFRKIGYILVAYVIVLIICYPRVIDAEFDFVFTSTLVLAMAISTFAQYFFGMTYRILLNADQCSYIVSLFQCLTTIFNTIISVILIQYGGSIQLVKLTSSLLFLLQPIGMRLYVNRNYDIDRKIKFSGEPIKQKWNGFAQHIAQIIATNTDTVVLTVFSTLSNVSVYTVYNLVISGIVSLFDALSLGFAPFLGNMIAKKEHDKIDSFFNLFEWAWHTLTSFIFVVTGLLIVPFVNIYTRDITDANYCVPVFGAIITLAAASKMLRTPYHIAISAAGHYKQTQMSSYIEAGLNIIVSVVAVSRWGLVGVAIGTLVAMTYRTCYLPLYLTRNILNRKLSIFIKHIIVDSISVIITLLAAQMFLFNANTYYEWILLALVITGIAFIIFICINFVFYKRILLNLFFNRLNIDK